jgi:tetratricopeptide (TPR) repeat protein
MDHVRSSASVLRVFLSSTFVDLQVHRAAVRDIVGRLGQFTLAMEQFGAREGDAHTVSTDLVAGCGVYLGVVAWRYGYVPAGQERSVTHLEYEEAGRLGIPRLVFLAAPETQAADGPADLFPAAARDPEHLDQLLAFRSEIERAQVVDYFTTPDDLAKKVAAALHQYLQAHPTEAALPPPHHFPPRAPGFVGREQDVRLLTEMVREGLRDGSATAVVGMGGLGKSSLAAEAVHLLAAPPPLFPGGLTWVRCEDRVGLPGLTWIADQLLAAWGASLPDDVTMRASTPEEGLELRERALRERLRPTQASAERAPALALLDNVEHALPVSRLLDTTTPLGITTLLTCRSEPSSPRVRLLRLEALASDAGVHLFAARYQARGRNWIRERDEATTRTIVEALGGLPLAIELAAARAARTQLPLVALTEELLVPDALARLTDPLDPSASVRYSLGRTLAALTPTQQVRFAALGVLAGPDWPRDVVEALFEGVPARLPEQVREDRPDDAQVKAVAQADLEALLAFSLAGLGTTHVAGAESSPRVRLHPLVRDLAREQCAALQPANQEDALHALLVSLQSWLARFVTLSASLQLVLDEELIAGALRAAAGRQVDLPLLIGVVNSWGLYLSVFRTRLDLEMRTLQLESARTIGDHRAELTALFAVAQESYALGRQDDALRCWREALSLARELGDHVRILEALCDVGGMLAERGSRAEAERMYDEANALARELGHALTNWGTLVCLGTFADTLGDQEAAERWWQQALEAARATGDQLGECKTLCDFGLRHEAQGEFEQARGSFDEALAVARVMGDPISTGVMLNDRGHLGLLAGDLEGAARDLSAALPLLTELRDRALAVRGNLAILAGLQAQRQGEREAAEQAFEEALRLFEQSTMPAFTKRIRYVRQLLADLRAQPLARPVAPTSEPSSAGVPTPAPEPVTAEPAGASASAPRAQRRWWSWGRRER